MQTPASSSPGLWIRRLIAMVLLATCIRVWFGPAGGVAPANAQIPDGGAQRLELIQEARRTNELLSDIRQTLKEHTFNVRLAGADKQPPPPVKSGGGGL